MKPRQGKAALYMRLSRDDELIGESMSITNQRKLLIKTAKDFGYSFTEEYIDDGISGTTFDRPAFLKVEAEIDAGNIACVITKDLSRIGRDHIRVGLFTQSFLVDRDVRLIAIHDNIDSDGGEFEYAAIRNVFNEMYARDASKKVRNACKARAMAGEPIGHAPYGYVKDPENSKRWVPDAEAAEVVRRIFTLTLAGKGAAQIADILAADKVYTPKSYWLSIGIRRGGIPANSDPYCWQHSTVISILKRQEYTGDIISFKSTSRVFGSKRRKRTPKEDRLIFSDIHEPIIAREDFERVQKMRDGAKRRPSKSSKNIFSCMLRCADCGATLSFHINPNNEDIAYYNCPHNNAKRKICDKTHYVRADFLKKVVLAEIKRITTFAKADEEAFVNILRENVGATTRQAENALKAQLARVQSRIDELEILFKRIYEDCALGGLNRDRMMRLAADYEVEQKELLQQQLKISEELATVAEQDAGVGLFTELVKKHSRIKKLTAAILHQFIDHIDIYQAEKTQERWTQQIDIYYNCIGKLQLPDTPKTKPKDVTLRTRDGVVLELAKETANDEVKIAS